jgi:hypothetical protein
MVEVGREKRRDFQVHATDIRADIGEEPTANGSSEALSDLYDTETLQQ